METGREPHQEEADHVNQDGPQIKPFGTVSMCEGSPVDGREGCTEGGARHNGPDPEERLLR